MFCTNHPSTTANKICSRCDTPLCGSCAQERGEKTFCPRCAEFVDRRAASGGRAAGASGSFNVGQPPAAATPATPPPPPVSAPPATGQLYEGPAAGDLYQPPAGDVYQGPASSGQPARTQTGSMASTPREVEGNLPRCLLFAFLAAMISAGVWYGIAVLSDYKVGYVALGVGWLIGIAAAAGAGGGGMPVAMVSVLATAFSLLAGDYMIARKYYQEIVTEIDQERQAWVDPLADGELTDAEVAEYWEMEPSDFAELSAEEQDEARSSARADLRAMRDAPAEEPLPFRTFWLMLTGWKDLVFYAIGLVAAFKVPMGKS